MNKAQASVELLVILAISMIAIGLILALSNNEITSVNSIKANSQAQNTVNKIAGTAEEVYISGTGTTKQIFISIPSGVNENKTLIENKTIRLNVNGTDLIAETGVEITGSIPTKEGSYWIWITAKEGYVVIGDIQIETDKGSIYSALAQNTNLIETITVINNTKGNAQVNVNVNWNETEVNLNTEETFFSVPADSNYSIDLNFTSNKNAVGNYTGEIIFNADTIDGTKQIIVPTTIEVITGNSNQPLMIFPAEWNLLIDAGSTDSNTFQVCNTSSQKLTNISFNASSGDAGNWIQSIPEINSLSANTCQEIIVEISVPLGAEDNTGTITASDGINSDFIELNVNVKGMKDNFNFSWDTAFFSDDSRLDNWTIENTSTTTEIIISRMKVMDWSITDNDNVLLRRIRFNGSTYWNRLTLDGEWADITDFTINSSTSYSSRNRLVFNGNARNDGEYYRIEFEFLDGTTYTTDTFYSQDLFPPAVVLEAPAPKFESNNFTVRFDFKTEDTDSGIAYCELIIDGTIDQTNNSITEGTTQSFTKTFTENKEYGWDVNCVDDSDSANKGGSDENRSIIINSTQPSPPQIIAFHDFPDLSWSSGTGWLYEWYHTGDSRIVFGNSYTGNYSLRLRRETGYIDRAVDLSAYINPRLQFWAKTNGFEPGDEAYAMVSSNDTDWTILKTFTFNEPNNTYVFYDFDLSSLNLSSEFWIAFSAGMNNRNDYFYVDDINIIQRTP